ncbi:MAG: sensor histidine kinase [Gaiellaceae bacterium]
MPAESGSQQDLERRRGERRREDAERARLADQLIAAEQEERRRIALHLHDGPVQSLAGIALMLDAALGDLRDGHVERSQEVLESALQRHRATIKALRDLSFNLEPVVLRDQGFEPAVRALAEHLGISNEIRVELEIGIAESFAERAQVTLYQIIREAFHQAIRRGPPRRMSVVMHEKGDGSIETLIVDDAPGERRRKSYEEIDERARMLGGKVSVRAVEGGGTLVRVTLPPYTVAR